MGIIARANYQTLASTDANKDIATAWKDKTMNDQMEEVEVDINENQELLNDWKDAKTVRTFSFFGQKNNIILRDEDDGSFVVGSKGKNVCVARQFKTIWFIASATRRSRPRPTRARASAPRAPPSRSSAKPSSTRSRRTTSEHQRQGACVCIEFFYDLDVVDKVKK